MDEARRILGVDKPAVADTMADDLARRGIIKWLAEEFVDATLDYSNIDTSSINI